MQLYLNYSLIMDTWEMEALFWSHPRDDGTELSKKMDVPYVVATTAKWVRDLGQHTENQRHELQPADIRSFDVCWVQACRTSHE